MGGVRWRRTLVSLLVSIWVGVAWAQVATTTVQDTVYRADGTAAGGSVVVSWSAFTTAGGTSVPAGTTSATISAGGVLATGAEASAASERGAGSDGAQQHILLGDVRGVESCEPHPNRR